MALGIHRLLNEDSTARDRGNSTLKMQNPRSALSAKDPLRIIAKFGFHIRERWVKLIWCKNYTDKTLVNIFPETIPQLHQSGRFSFLIKVGEEYHYEDFAPVLVTRLVYQALDRSNKVVISTRTSN